MPIIDITGLGKPRKEGNSPEAGKIYDNYMALLNQSHPNEPIATTPEKDKLDHASNNGYSILQLVKSVQLGNIVEVPTHPERPRAIEPSLPPRDVKKLSSETFADTVLMSLCSEGKDPKDLIKAFGKNAAYINDRNGNITYLAILDPYTHKMTAYKMLAVERDMHTDPQNRHADPNGFSAAAFIKLKVDDTVKADGSQWNSANEFMQAHRWNLDGLAKEPQVRVEYGGFQLNLENWSLPGRLDRGEMSKQVSRVLDFNKLLAAKMREEGLPADTQVSHTAHSLAALSATMGRFYWEHNPELKKQGKAGHVTLHEPIAEVEAIRQAAFLIATQKNVAGQKTDVETEVRNLLKDTDIVVNQHRSKLLSEFLVYGAKENNGIAGSRMFEIPNDASFELSKLKLHFSVHMGEQMLKAPAGLVEIQHPAMMTPEQVAEQPKNDQYKDRTDTFIRNVSYRIASTTAAKENDGFKWDKENDFWQTARDIGQSLGISQQAVDATVSAAHVPNRIAPDTSLSKK